MNGGQIVGMGLVFGSLGFEIWKNYVISQNEEEFSEDPKKVKDD